MGTRKGSSAFSAPTPQGTRQGMYVAFVKNAMVQKAQVSYARICYTAEEGGCHMKVCVNGGLHSCRDNMRRTMSS
mgnify:CR=1 FL=1